MTWHKQFTLLTIYIILLLGTFQTVFAATEENEATEMIVSGRLQGPPMWEIISGDHKLVIFGLPGDIPELLLWNSEKVERVLDEAQAVMPLLEIKLDVGRNPFTLMSAMNTLRKSDKLAKGQTIEAFIDPILFLRITALQKTYGPKGNSLHRLRPRAIANKLKTEAEKNIGIKNSASIRRKINQLIKRHDLESFNNNYKATVSKSEMKQMYEDLDWQKEITCLEETILSLETDLDESRERAFSWSYGEMSEIYLQDYPDPNASCWTSGTSGDVMSLHMDKASNLWLQNAETALNRHSVTFGMLSMRNLLSPNGLLAKLEARGYEVRRP